MYGVVEEGGGDQKWLQGALRSVRVRVRVRDRVRVRVRVRVTVTVTVREAGPGYPEKQSRNESKMNEGKDNNMYLKM